MPVTIRKFNKKNLRRFPGTKKTPVTRNEVATIAKKVTMKQIETKKTSLEALEVSLSTLGGVHDQSVVSTIVGDGHGGRDGHMLQPVGIDVRGHLKNNTAAAAIYKICLVQIKNNLANPSLDFLETNISNVDLTGGDLSTMYRRINTDSYRVLASRFLKVGVQDDNVKMFKMYVDMRKFRKMVYEGLTLSEPNYGRVHLIAFGRGTANDGENFVCELSYNATFYFKDA